MTASRPTAFEMEAYCEIVEDSLRTHYWALRGDPVVKVLQQRLRPRQPSPLNESVLIAYYRRVWLALQFARTAALLDPPDPGSPRQQLLQQWQWQLDGLEKVIMKKVVLNSEALRLAESFMPRCAERALEEDLRSEFNRTGAVGGAPPFPTD